MDYLAIKHVHMSCAAASGGLFLLRGGWMLRDSAMLQKRWVSIVPHLVDSVLLASALIMVFQSRQYPFVLPWLTAKVVALVVYIGLGAVALKRGRSKSIRSVALLAALVTFAYIVLVALTRHPALLA